MTRSSPVYTFRAFGEADLDAVAEVLAAVFEQPVSRDYLRWKFCDTPAGQGLSTVLVCEDRPVGFHGNLPVRYRAVVSEVLAVQGVDFAVLPAHRRIDTFLGMVNSSTERMRQRKVEFTYGIPLEDAAALNATVLGDDVVASVPLLVRVLNVERALGRRGGGGLPARVAGACARVLGRSTRPIAPPAGTCLRRIERFDERFDRFWERVQFDYPLMTIRDTATLNWRYMDAVGRAYEACCLEESAGGRVVGFVVTGTAEWKGLRRGKIVDLVTPREGGTAAARCLIRWALNRFREDGVDIADCWMFPHVHLYPELRRCGFVPRGKGKRGLHVTSVGLSGAPVTSEFLKTVENWHLCIGDSDTG